MNYWKKISNDRRNLPLQMNRSSRISFWWQFFFFFFKAKSVANASDRRKDRKKKIYFHALVTDPDDLLSHDTSASWERLLKFKTDKQCFALRVCHQYSKECRKYKLLEGRKWKVSENAVMRGGQLPKVTHWSWSHYRFSGLCRRPHYL